jgi:hypothetical protein
MTFLEKLEECTKLDFADKGNFAYNVFSCESMKNGSETLIKSYNSSIEKFNYAAKSVVNSDIKTMREQYKVVMQDLELITKVLDQTKYDECKIKLEKYVMTPEK